MAKTQPVAAAMGWTKNGLAKVSAETGLAPCRRKMLALVELLVGYDSWNGRAFIKMEGFLCCYTCSEPLYFRKQILVCSLERVTENKIELFGWLKKKKNPANYSSSPSARFSSFCSSLSHNHQAVLSLCCSPGGSEPGQCMSLAHVLQQGRLPVGALL